MATSEKAKEFSYKDASAELERIVAGISAGDIDIDTLAESVQRASQLIRACRERLRAVETDVQAALEEMERDLKDAEPDGSDDELAFSALAAAADD